MKKLLMLVFGILILSGCSTIPTANPSGHTLIESDPPGARIDIGSQYVGITPLRVNIPRTDYWSGSKRSVTIVANPVLPGQQVQIKIVGSDDPTPTHIFFDMNLVRNI
ncbi:MAG: PEGA domain-containing protein [Candidatus Omnitrophota bacterium]